VGIIFGYQSTVGPGGSDFILNFFGGNGMWKNPLNRNTFLGTLQNYKYIFTNLLSALSASSNLVLGDNGDTASIKSNRDIEISDVTKGIFTHRLSSLKTTFPNEETLNIGFNDVANYTGIISLNQNVEIPNGRTIKTTDIKSTSATDTLSIGNNLTTSSINLGTISTMTGGINLNSNVNIGSSLVNKSISCNLFQTFNNSDSMVIGKTTTTGSINLGTISTMTGGINLNSNVSIGSSIVNKSISCNSFQTFNNSDLMRFGTTTTTGQLRICENLSTGSVVIGSSTSDSTTTIGGLIKQTRTISGVG
jgi:hypothetical protein